MSKLQNMRVIEIPKFRAVSSGPNSFDVTEADTAPYEIIEFKGGMYLVATADENDPDDLNETVGCMVKWIETSDVFEKGD